LLNVSGRPISKVCWSYKASAVVGTSQESFPDEPVARRSRNLSSGAHSRDPLARKRDRATEPVQHQRSLSWRLAASDEPVGFVSSTHLAFQSSLPVYTSRLSNKIISAPPVANFCTSAAAALPSALPKPACTAARLSK
jgi:hypothetical protein